MALGYACFDSYGSVGYVLTLHISPPYSLPIQAYVWGCMGAILYALKTETEKVTLYSNYHKIPGGAKHEKYLIEI